MIDLEVAAVVALVCAPQFLVLVGDVELREMADEIETEWCRRIMAAPPRIPEVKPCGSLTT